MTKSCPRRIRLHAHLARLEGLPGELGDGIVVHGLALSLELLLEVKDPAQHLLVGQTVERPSKGIEASRVGEVRVSERAADLLEHIQKSNTLAIRHFEPL